MTRLAAAVASGEFRLLGLAAPLLLFPGIWSPVGLAIITLAMPCRWMAFGRLSARTAMGAPIVLLLVMGTVSLKPSLALDLSLNRLCALTLGVALFCGLINSIDDHLPPPPISGFPASGALEQYDLVNPRLVAGTLAILLLIPLGYLALGNGWKLRLLSGLGAAAMPGVLALTQSPQGLLGLGATARQMVLLWTRWALLALPLGMGPLLLTPRYVGFQQFLVRLLGPEGIDSHLLNLNSRIVSRATGMSLIRDMPHTRSGPNNFPVLDGLYSSGGSRAVHAHGVLF